MANPEHLAKLREGVSVWNAWRDENEGVQVDLSGADLAEADLAGANLNEANLANISFGDTTLTETTGLDTCFGREG